MNTRVAVHINPREGETPRVKATFTSNADVLALEGHNGDVAIFFQRGDDNLELTTVNAALEALGSMKLEILSRIARADAREAVAR